MAVHAAAAPTKAEMVTRKLHELGRFYEDYAANCDSGLCAVMHMVDNGVDAPLRRRGWLISPLMIAFHIGDKALDCAAPAVANG